MKGRHWLLALLAVLVAPAAGLDASDAAAEPTTDVDEVVVTLFYGEGCPYCAAERAFLDGLHERLPALVVHEHEVWYDEANQARFREMADEHGVEPQAVPTTFVGDQVWVGFDETIGQQIEDAATRLVAGQDPVDAERTTVDVPLVGQVDVGDRSLVVATLLIGFVDGINPCSLWVLSMLMALVLHSGSRSRVLVVGALFLTVTAVLYGLFMAGVYGALDVVGEAQWIRLVVAAVALTFGVLHLKEHVTHRGPSVTIPDARKPGMYRRMRGLAAPDRSLPAVLAGTAALAVGVSLVETPCTAGLPVLWTDLLAGRNVSGPGVALLFVLYLAVFLVDELVVFTLAVVTLRATRLQEQHGRALQLVSGTLMVALALAMLLAPELLESVRGTAQVFGTAGLVVAAVLVAEWAWARGRQPHVAAH